MVDQTDVAVAGEILAGLPRLLADTRISRGLSLRSAAQQIGVSDMTVAKIERGYPYRTDSAVKVLKWIGGAS